MSVSVSLARAMSGQNCSACAEIAHPLPAYVWCAVDTRAETVYFGLCADHMQKMHGILGAFVDQWKRDNPRAARPGKKGAGKG